MNAETIFGLYSVSAQELVSSNPKYRTEGRKEITQVFNSEEMFKEVTACMFDVTALLLKAMFLKNI